MKYTHQEVFVAADQALAAVIDQIKDDQWEMPIPEGTSWKPVKDLHELINYHAYDEIWIPDTLAGKTTEEVGSKYDGDLLGDDPKASYRKLVDIAEKAVNALKVEDLQRKVHLTYGEWSIKDFLEHISNFRTFRTVVIARLIGVDDTLPVNLVEGMWEITKPVVEDLRKLGVFGPEIKVAEDAPLQERLLGLAGYPPKKQ